MPPPPHSPAAPFVSLLFAIQAEYFHNFPRLSALVIRAAKASTPRCRVLHPHPAQLRQEGEEGGPHWQSLQG